MMVRLIAIAAAAWLAAVPARADDASPGGLAGTWVRDARERDDAARDAAIVRATEPLSFAFRGIARSVMRSRMVPSERYVIAGGDAPSIRKPDTGEEMPLDGRRLVTGKDHEVTTRVVAPGEIEQVWKHGPESHGTTRWRLTGRDRLVISQTVHDSHFEQPIEYSTSYRREP